MTDLTAPLPLDPPVGGAAPLERVRGAARVTLGAGGRLGGLHQSGSAKVFLPDLRQPGPRGPEVVYLNTAGGLTAGDRLSYGLTLAPGVAAVGTTQTAERAYRAREGAATMAVTLELGAGARLDWLPQETILFEQSALDRTTCIEMAPDAEALMAETVVLGRAAMGEVLTRVAFSDRRVVRVAGRPFWTEPFGFEGADLGAAPALLGGARAVSTLALLAPGGGARAEDLARALQARLPAILDRVRASGRAAPVMAVTGFRGRLIARMAATDVLGLRRALAHALEFLRPGAPLPRVWQI
ncbi:urease accessory protein UreD [Phaeovulum vinaykumarii]|uniref:Urease accessory protein UreD n=1 Tax=Phaeovulum vinaykumarii TaxID=407234 RepID=A0A1N7LWC3_9RHOB|nr:urease accessory protein UreD [Phaeovulum vinaykumarii]SIS78155.1 urease accessory protein [Phaeovulum vinaykumarii]SOC07132.1 urease accessory protein [Phaeovulum vinaykumarii]